MSDEAFARRFYSDRAELTALGVPLQSQRDEFTGEELYTLRSEHYFLDRLELDDDELAALQTALYYLEGKFAYAEPFRLALQNLALGRTGFTEPPTDTAERVRVSAPDYSPELAGRLSKLESAISKQRTVRFGYWSPRRTRPGERARQSLRAPAGRRQLVRDRPRPRSQHRSNVQGLANSRRHPLRHEARARLPRSSRTSTSRSTACRDRGRSASPSGPPESPSPTTPPGGWSARFRTQESVEDGVFETDVRERRAPRRLGPAPERSRGRAWSRTSSKTPSRPGSPASPSRTRGRRRYPRGRSGAIRGSRSPSDPSARSHPSASACSRRCSLSFSPRAAKSGRRCSMLPSSPVGSPFRSRSSRSTSRCSTSSTSAEGATRSTRMHDGDVVRVDKELYGDVFRQAAEAHAARGPSDPARDRVRRPDDRGRCAHASSSASAASSRRRSAGSISPRRPSRGAPRTRRRS